MARKPKIDTTSDNKPDNRVTYWLNEISAAKKREKGYRETGERILKIYDGCKADTTPFNILFSNTETLLPALYSAVPRPLVQRRFKDNDPLGKAAAIAGQRVLEFLLDTNMDGYETFDEAVRSATLDALLPGRGVTCIKYDADFGEIPSEQPKQSDGYGEAEAGTPYKKSELVCCDTRAWNKVFFGYAKKWSQVPWLAYEEYIDRKEAERLFGEEIAKQLVYTEAEDDPEEGEKRNDDERNKGEKKTCCVYQIWDKEGGRKVRYVSPQYNKSFLKVDDDPLGLTGFFNMPKPMQFVEKSNDLLPTAMYLLYENQAKELNQISLRINRVVRAIKAKALYDGELGDDIKNLVEADDNMMVPADKTSALAAEKGLDNAIWFWPIDKLIATLVQLYTAREQCKQVIYEITGISDIIRGSSVASETATAQNIKTQWGTLRLKRLQKEVQRYARDMLRMMLEIAATKFSEETWAKMTGLPYLTSAQRQQAVGMAKAFKEQVQAVLAKLPPGTDAPPMPPQVQQQAQQIQAQLAQPVWSDVLGMLNDDIQRAYRVDIETNSTVEPEAVEDQKNISDLMTALGQFLNGIGPMVAKGVMPFEAAQTMLLAITRRFRFGSEIEDQIKAMKAPPPDDGGAAAQQQAEMQRLQAESQIKLKEIEAKTAADERSHQLEIQKMQIQAQLDRDRLANEMQIARDKAALEMQVRRDEHAMAMRRSSEEMKALKQKSDVEIRAVKTKASMDSRAAKEAMRGRKKAA